MSAQGLSSEKVCDFAVARIAKLFALSADSIRKEMVFGEDLKPSFKSDWMENELDQLYHDFLDVMDKDTYKSKFLKGGYSIKTVGDFCKYMADRYQKNPELVMEILLRE